ncbi:hypothetical protein SACS_0767 [Parasaccharibacter apium]|uniref:Uncharacterized protein n=1 Tax=Parasaccharibacter apium TaxID=1510841 RepID=A0A7U7G5G7_9PROT|nr:hypothetical protein SACS_0767 [Parasaccharibacter apium]
MISLKHISNWYIFPNVKSYSGFSAHFMPLFVLSFTGFF